MGFLGDVFKVGVGALTGGPAGALAAGASIAGRKLAGGGGKRPILVRGKGGRVFERGLPELGGVLASAGRTLGSAQKQVQDRARGRVTTTTTGPSVRLPFGIEVGRTRTETTTFGGQVTRGPAEMQQAGCVCGAGKPSACACGCFNGTRGRLNKSRYFRKTDRCADSNDPNSYELVAPESVCVKPRRSVNPANSKAAGNAMRRIEAHHKQLVRTEKIIRQYAKKAKR